MATNNNNGAAANNAAPKDYAPGGLNGVQNAENSAAVQNALQYDLDAFHVNKKDPIVLSKASDVRGLSQQQLNAFQASDLMSRASSPIEMQTLQDVFGDDYELKKREDLITQRGVLSIAQNPSLINDYNALGQHAAQRWANSVFKMATTAATTFASSVISPFAALGNLIYVGGKAALGGYDSDKEAQDAFLKALSVDPFTELMGKANRLAEEFAPVYRTNDQINNPWKFKNLFSSAFLGDSILKNLGFTIGAAYGGKVQAGMLSKLMGMNKTRDAFKGVVKALSDSKGDEYIEQLYKDVMAGKVTITGEQLVDEFARLAKKVKWKGTAQAMHGAAMGAMGEARIEAENNTKDWYELEESKINNAYATMYSEDKIMDRLIEANAQGQETYHLVVNPYTGQQQYELTPYGEQMFKDLQKEGESEREKAIDKAQRERAQMANNIFLLESLLLTGTNAFSFGRFFGGGYKAERMAMDSARRAAKPIRKLARNADNLTSGELVSQMGQESVKAAKKAQKLAKIGKWVDAAADPAVQGFEEGFQSWISNSAGVLGSADLNRFMGYTVDPEANLELTNMFNALRDNFAETFSSGEAWQEILVGAFSSIIGIPGFGYAHNADGRVEFVEDAKTGKKKPKRVFQMQGNIWDVMRENKFYGKDSQAVIDKLNEIVSQPDFANKLMTFVRHTSLENRKREAAESGNIFAYKNDDAMQMMSDILGFYKAGRIEDLYEMIDVAMDIENEDPEELRRQGVDPRTGKNIFDGWSNDQIKAYVKKNAESYKKGVDTFLKIREDVEKVYGADVDADFLDTITWGVYTLDDTGNRLTELSKQLEKPLAKLIEKLNIQIDDDDKKIVSDRNGSYMEKLFQFITDTEEGYNLLNKVLNDTGVHDAVYTREHREELLNYLNCWIKQQEAKYDKLADSEKKDVEDAQKTRERITEADFYDSFTNSEDGFKPGEVFDITNDLLDALALVQYRQYVYKGIHEMAKDPTGIGAAVVTMEQAALEETRKQMLGPVWERFFVAPSEGVNKEWAKDQENFNEILDELEGSMYMPEIRERIENGDNDNYKYWLAERDAAADAKNVLFATIRGFLRDWRVTNIGKITATNYEDLNKQARSIYNYIRANFTGRNPHTIDEIIGWLDSIAAGKAVSPKVHQQLLVIAENFRHVYNLKELAEKLVKPEPEPQPQPAPQPQPQPSNNPGGNPGSNPGGGQSSSKIDKERIKNIITGDGPLSIKNIRSWTADKLSEQKNGKYVVSDQQLQQMKADLEVLKTLGANNREVAEVLSQITGIPTAELQGIGTRIVGLYNLIAAKDKGEIDLRKTRGKKPGPPAPGDNGQGSSQKTDQAILDAERDQANTILSEISTLSDDDLQDLYINYRYKGQAITNQFVSPEQGNSIVQEIWRAAQDEINRRLDDERAATAIDDDSIEAGNIGDARGKSNEGKTNFGNEQALGGNTVTDVNGSEIQKRSTGAPITVLPGLPITKYSIPDLIKGNLTNYQIAGDTRDLDALRDLLDSFAVYDFIDGGGLGLVYNYYKSQGKEVPVHFVVDPSNTIMRNTQTQDGKHGLVWNIGLAIEVNDEIGDLLSELEEDGRTNYQTINGKKYQIIGVVSKGSGTKEETTAYNNIYHHVNPEALPKNAGLTIATVKDEKGNSRPLTTTIANIGSGRMATQKDGVETGFRPLSKVIGDDAEGFTFAMILPSGNNDGTVVARTNDPEVNNEAQAVMAPVLGKSRTAGTIWLITRDAKGDVAYSYLKVASLKEASESQDFMNSEYYNVVVKGNMNTLFHKGNFLERLHALQNLLKNIYLPKGYRISVNPVKGQLNVVVHTDGKADVVIDNADALWENMINSGASFKVTVDDLNAENQSKMMELAKAGVLQSDYVDDQHHGANFTINFLKANSRPNTNPPEEGGKGGKKPIVEGGRGSATDPLPNGYITIEDAIDKALSDSHMIGFTKVAQDEYAPAIESIRSGRAKREFAYKISYDKNDKSQPMSSRVYDGAYAIGYTTDTGHRVVMMFSSPLFNKDGSLAGVGNFINGQIVEDDAKSANWFNSWKNQAIKEKMDNDATDIGQGTGGKGAGKKPLIGSKSFAAAVHKVPGFENMSDTYMATDRWFGKYMDEIVAGVSQRPTTQEEYEKDVEDFITRRHPEFLTFREDKGGGQRPSPVPDPARPGPKPGRRVARSYEEIDDNFDNGDSSEGGWVLDENAFYSVAATNFATWYVDSMRDDGLYERYLRDNEADGIQTPDNPEDLAKDMKDYVNCRHKYIGVI